MLCGIGNLPKKALHELFMSGQIMISGRNNFQKIYDLTERVLPSNIDTSIPSTQEFSRFLILAAIEAHGLIAEKEITYLRKGIGKDIKLALKNMLENGDLIEIEVEKLPSKKYYTTQKVLNESPKAIRKPKVHFLSPFDNSIIQRKRVGDLFDFEYQTEIYLPSPKRKFGYFSLPVLYGDQLIARINPKADRKTKVLHIQDFHFEENFEIFEKVKGALAKKIIDFAQFNACETIQVSGESELMINELNKLIDNEKNISA